MTQAGDQTPLRRYRTIIGQGIWVFVGQAVSAIFLLAGTRLITQFVNPELYGAVNLVQNALVLLRTLFCSPTLNAGLRYYPDAERGGYRPAFRRFLSGELGRALVVMEILAIVGGIIWSLAAGVHLSVVLVLVVLVGADVARTLEMTLFNAARRQRPAAILSAVENLARPLLVVGGVLFLGKSVEVILGAIAASVLITLALLYVAVKPVGSSDEIALPRHLAAEMRQYAIPLIPIALLNWITSVSDRYIIASLSHDAVSLGVYAAGYGLISQPFLVINAIIALTLRPAYFSAVARNDEAHAKRVFGAWLAITASICGIATLAIYFARVFLVEGFLGPQYRGAIEYVPWIALGYLFYVVEQVLEQPLLAHKRTFSVLVAQVCGAVASLVVTIPLVIHIGAVGAAYACPVYFLIQALVAATLVRRRNAS